MSTTAPHFPFRLAAIDIDGTLLGPDSKMSPENADAIARLRARGVRVVLASGRRHENMIRFHHALGLDTPLVSCQGALVKEDATGRVLHHHPISAALAAEAVRDGMAEGMTIVYYQDHGIYISERNYYTDLYHSRGGDPLIEGVLREITDAEPLKMIWIHSAEKIAASLDAIRARYHGRLETVVTYPEYLEFIDVGVSKATGVAAVAAEYGIAPAEVLAFGDADNDIPLFQWAGRSVAMSESTPAAKAAAHFVAPAGDPATSLARAIDGVLSGS